MVARIQKRLGKAQARDEFPKLVDSVANGSGLVEITDYGKVTAVLISLQEYQWLLACAQRSGKPMHDAEGCLVLTSENALEEGARETQEMFDAALRKTANEL